MSIKFKYYILLIGFLLNSCGQISHEKFDSDKWQHSNLNLEENWDLRWNMMNDLRKKHVLIGMTKLEILKLLGRPDGNDNTEFYYDLGMTGKGVNTGTLTITFDKNDIVKKINVHQG